MKRKKKPSAELAEQEEQGAQGYIEQGAVIDVREYECECEYGKYKVTVVKRDNDWASMYWEEMK